MGLVRVLHTIAHTELSLALSGLGGSVRTPVTRKLGAPKGWKTPFTCGSSFLSRSSRDILCWGPRSKAKEHELKVSWLTDLLYSLTNAGLLSPYLNYVLWWYASQTSVGVTSQANHREDTSSWTFSLCSLTDKGRYLLHNVPMRIYWFIINPETPNAIVWRDFRQNPCFYTVSLSSSSMETTTKYTYTYMEEKCNYRIIPITTKSIP